MNQEAIGNKEYKFYESGETIYKVVGVDGELVLLRRWYKNETRDKTKPYVVTNRTIFNNKGFTPYPEITYLDEIPDTFKLPVYYKSLDFAIKEDKVESYHVSKQQNEVCAKAIDSAIISVAKNKGIPGADTYDLNKALSDVINKFGIERVYSVVAYTVKHYDWDGRISDQNKNWAQKTETPEDSQMLLETHLAVLDGFINYIRKRTGAK